MRQQVKRLSYHLALAEHSTDTAQCCQYCTFTADSKLVAASSDGLMMVFVWESETGAQV